MTRGEKAAQTRKRKAAERADFNAMMAAAADERVRFNRAIQAGKRIVITVRGVREVVQCVTPDWWYIAAPEHVQRPGPFDMHHWCGCNDGQWADMMRDAGVPRNPRWAHLTSK